MELAKEISPEDAAAIHRHWVDRVNDPADRVVGIPPRKEFQGVYGYIVALTTMQWPITEISDQGVDCDHFMAMDPGSRQIVERIIALFVVADKIVEDALEATGAEPDDGERLPLEYAMLIRSQEGAEVVHYYVYNLLVAMCLPPDRRPVVYELARGHPAIQQLVRWMQRWTAPERPLYIRNAARTVFELVVFTAQFMVPHELKKNSQMPSFTNANERIAPDESMHAACGFEMHRAAFGEAIGTPGPVRAAANAGLTFLVRSCYDAALPLFSWIYEGGARMNSITEARALEYTRGAANTLLRGVGAEPAFVSNAEDPQVSSWLRSLTLERMGRTNFFEDDALAYSKKFSEDAFVWSDGAAGFTAAGLGILQAS